VLAAGRGQRLARLTRALYGRDVPKQFAELDGERSFLQQAVARAARLAAPERTIVVVAAEHADLARDQLEAFEGVSIVEQPRDVGTLPGLLLPLAHVLDADPHARVVVHPSDHHVERLAPLLEALRAALGAIDRTPGRAVLVGARAEHAATDLGWIETGAALAPDDAVRAVARFVEKPPAPTAAHLLASGALWNTLLLAFDGAAFWDEAFDVQPALEHPFHRYRSSIGSANEAAVRREVYGELPVLDLSRDLLASRPGLAVVALGDAGWSDCGTPERLLRCLERGGRLGWLLGRLAETGFAGVVP
jgi:mannose-1-phosphate guanylyltransferase